MPSLPSIVVGGSAMSATDWRIPPSVTRWLAEMPVEAPVALLLRHSVRGPLPHGDAGNTVPLTRDGVRLARRLGAGVRRVGCGRYTRVRFRVAFRLPGAPAIRC